MKKRLYLTMLVLLMVPVISPQANADDGAKALDCSKTNLQAEVDKLDKNNVNILSISGNCTEDVVVSGFADLTLTGAGNASLTATTFIPDNAGDSTIALSVERSKITVHALTINAGGIGVSCRRSTCIISDVTIQGGHNGIQFLDQALGDVLGSTVIQNNIGDGLGVYGASSVNIRPWDGFPPGNEPGPVISGNGVGAAVFDGSFLRSDNGVFQGNGYGIWIMRDAIIKIYGQNGGVTGSSWDGVIVDYGSTAAVSVPITDNGGLGVYVGPLSTFYGYRSTVFLNNGGGDVFCAHPTSVSQPSNLCGN